MIKIYLTEEETRTAEAYAKKHRMPLNVCMKNVFFAKIEEEYDIALADTALVEYEKNHKTYSHEEIKKKLEL